MKPGDYFRKLVHSLALKREAVHVIYARIKTIKSVKIENSK